MQQDNWMTYIKVPTEKSEAIPEIRSPRNGDIHVDIDIIDRCNLQCPTCWRGVAALPNTSELMPLARFQEIVNKIHAEGYPNLALINWTEPFLCTTLHEYIPAIRETGMDSWLSSNLSLSPKEYLHSIIRTLEAGVDILFVSVSGFTQEIYEINHKLGKVDWIRTNLEGIAQEMRAGRIKTSVWVRYLEFPYNSHEKQPWAEFCKSLGIGFNAVPAHGDPRIPLPSEKTFNQHVEDRLQQTESQITPEQNPIPQKVCSLIADRVAIDAKGDVYLCCAYPNSERLRIGAYVDLDEHELLLRRHEHPFCTSCTIDARRDLNSKDQDRFRKAREQRLSQSEASISLTKRKPT